VLAAGVYGKSVLHQPDRYRPGREWNHAPSWFSAHPDVLADAPAGSGATTATGGASGEW
jgi:hypothetical protein